MGSYCVFVERAPRVEVRGGMVFVIGDKCELAVTPAVLGKFVAQANRALDQIHEARTGSVVRFSPKPHS